jgi:hypothetical protein
MTKNQAETTLHRKLTPAKPNGEGMTTFATERKLCGVQWKMLLDFKGGLGRVTLTWEPETDPGSSNPGDCVSAEIGAAYGKPISVDGLGQPTTFSKFRKNGTEVRLMISAVACLIVYTQPTESGL